VVGRLAITCKNNKEEVGTIKHDHTCIPMIHEPPKYVFRKIGVLLVPDLE
jgi:hypothetical protein